MGGPAAEPFSTGFQRELDRLFRLRRDVRRFRPDPVSRTLVAELLDLTGLAPSVGLSEPWRYVEVSDPDAREVVRSSFRRCNAEALAGYSGEDARLYASLKLAGLDVAPVQLAVFRDASDRKGRGLGVRTMPEMLDHSVVCSVMLFWLAARARGLGVGWVSILDPDEVARAVAAGPDRRLIAYLCVGWPETEEDEVPELERAGWERRRGMRGRVG